MQTTPTYRTNAIAAGILFIIATAFLFVGEAFYKPHLTGSDILARAALAKNQVALGVLIEFACVLAIPLIAVALYPVLRKVSATLAIGYVAFRLFEAAIFADLQTERLLILALSEAYLAAPGAQYEALETLARVMTGGEAWSGTSGPIYNLVFVIGMLMLNGMLWRSRLVARWISGWGLVSAVVLGGVAVWALFGAVPTTVAIALIAPLALQEMVLAFWFIFKGFDPQAMERLFAT